MGSRWSKNDDSDSEPEPKKRRYGIENDYFREAVPDNCFEVPEQMNKRRYEILNSEQAKKLRSTIVQECHQTSQIPIKILEICLRSKKVLWDKNSLFDYLFDDKKVDEFYADLKFPNEMHERDLQFTLENEEDTCIICFEDKRLSKYNCGHVYCDDCWEMHFSAEILGGKHLVKCPGFGCDKVVDSYSTRSLLRNAEIVRKLEENILEDFVQTHPELSWCKSGRGCTRIIKLRGPSFDPVRCHCGYEYCSLCNGEWHTPIKCSLLAAFKAKIKAETLTGNWIIVHTKQCPKCHSNIEKSGGCNLMTCRNRSCGFKFCWVCLTEWSKHVGDGYTCNKFDTKNSAFSDARADLERFLHYCNRYDNHKVSMQFEKRVMEHVSKIMDDYDKRGDTDDGQLMRNTMTRAVIILYKAKRCLQHTYAFAYHVKKDSNLEIFEINQRDLEVSSEVLSANLEHDLRADITKDEFQALRTKVLEGSVYCMNRREKLIEHVFEGIRLDSWKYI